MLFEITIVVNAYHVCEDIWKVEISLELPFYLSQIIKKIILQQQSFDCFEAAGTTYLAALVE